ncbi:MAG: hypothetical protein V4598_05385 [Bdellovibrionota bacterium]
MKLKLLVFLFVFQSLPVSALSVVESERQLAILDASVYNREVIYEALDLPVEDRARRETGLMLETVKTQVESVYRNLLAQTGNVELAISGVREKIEDDTRKISPELRAEIREVAFGFLDSIARGEAVSTETSAPRIEMEMAKTSIAHSNLLRSGFILLNEKPEEAHLKMLPAQTVRRNDVTEYKNKAELIASLTSLESSSMGGNLGSGAWINSSKSTSAGGSVSYRVSVNFLGANLNAGPSLSFNRTFSTSVSVSGDGLSPLTSRNDFDFYVRDENGKIKMKNGKPERRYLTFGCNADLNFNTSVMGSGGISVMGVGADVSASRSYSNSVGLNSRRVAIPEYIEGKTVNMGVLAQICHRDFLNAKLRSNLTLKDSLNIMMRDVISTLVYSNPKTKCVTDSHCANWFNKNVRPVSGNTAVGRCLEESREHYFACYARGVAGTKCPISANGKLITDGKNEYACDRGLRCVQVKEYGWLKSLSIFQYAEGRCRK